MPTPVGHALGGLAAAFAVDAAYRRQQLSPALLVAAAAAAVAPDLDLLAGSHRGGTHSIGAVLIVGVATLIVSQGRVASATRAAVLLMAAYASHLGLDWLGTDTSVPPGLTIAWPFSSAYYVSGLNVFGEVSRRYWRWEEFVLGNLRALSWEVALLSPVLILAWALWSRRTTR
jgi:membrane-bound metal-dependent hydrolase YbcI (DUF457 family)